jgi:hypothetical protein
MLKNKNPEQISVCYGIYFAFWSGTGNMNLNLGLQNEGKHPTDWA